MQPFSQTTARFAPATGRTGEIRVLECLKLTHLNSESSVSDFLAASMIVMALNDLNAEDLLPEAREILRSSCRIMRFVWGPI